MHHSGKLNIFLFETLKCSCTHTKQSWQFVVTCSLIFFLKIPLFLLQLEIASQAQSLQRKYKLQDLAMS